MDGVHSSAPREMQAVRRIEVVVRIISSSSLLLALALAVMAAVSSNQDSRPAQSSLLQAEDLIKKANKEAAALRLLTGSLLKAKSGGKPGHEEELASVRSESLAKSSDTERKGLRKSIENSKEKTHLEHIRSEEKAKREEKAEMASHCIFCKTEKKTNEQKAVEDLAMQKFSSLAAKSKEDRLAKKRKLTSEDKAKINAAALKIASVMQRDDPAVSGDVERAMARIHKSGTSWNALWGDSSSSLRGENRAQFQYLAGKPRVFAGDGDGEGVGDEEARAGHGAGDANPISFSKDPFGSNFHY